MSQNEMIERALRAWYDHQVGLAQAKFSERLVVIPFDDMPAEKRSELEGSMRAAIVAMREPSEAMVSAMDEALSEMAVAYRLSRFGKPGSTPRSSDRAPFPGGPPA